MRGTIWLFMCLLVVLAVAGCNTIVPPPGTYSIRIDRAEVIHHGVDINCSLVDQDGVPAGTRVCNSVAWSFDWGDGTVEDYLVWNDMAECGVGGSHSYDTPGEYTITVDNNLTDPVAVTLLVPRIERWLEYTLFEKELPVASAPGIPGTAGFSFRFNTVGDEEMVLATFHSNLKWLQFLSSGTELMGTAVGDVVIVSGRCLDPDSYGDAFTAITMRIHGDNLEFLTVTDVEVDGIDFDESILLGTYTRLYDPFS